MEWLIQMHAAGGYTIFDGDGKQVATFATNNLAAVQHVFALQEVQRAREAVSKFVYWHNMDHDMEPAEELQEAYDVAITMAKEIVCSR